MRQAVQAFAVEPAEPDRSKLPQLLALASTWPNAVPRLIILLTAGILAWHGWGHWGHFQLDCGRELYVPQEILRGKLLYRDVWFPYGPLGPYLQALLIKAFGEHLSVFYLYGITITTISALLALQIALILEERAAGLTAAMLVLFQGFEPSLFSYIFPYTYSAPLGACLSLLALYCAMRHVLGRSEYSLIMASVAGGLAVLCKPEFGAACYVMLAFMILAKTAIWRSGRIMVRDILACAPGIALWASIYGWFAWKLSVRFILFHNFLFIPGSYFMRTYGLQFTQRLGMRFIPAEVFLLILNAVAALLFWYGVAKVRERYCGRWAFTCLVLIVAALLTGAHGSAALRHFATVLWIMIFPPGIFFIGCGFMLVVLYKCYTHPGQRKPLAEACLAVLGVTLAFRIFAQIEPVDYGIYYDVTLFITFAIVLSRCTLMSTATSNIEVRQKVVNSVLTAEVALLAIVLVPLFTGRFARLETSWGGIYMSRADAEVTQQLLTFILKKKSEGRRVIVLPEPDMVYAMTRTEAAGRWVTLIPGVLSPAEELDYIADLKRVNPEYLVITNRMTREYGAAFFGIDYDRAISAWINQHYRVDRDFGSFHRDASVQGFAAELYARRAAQ
jgi:hypothetical protein